MIERCQGGITRQARWVIGDNGDRFGEFRFRSDGARPHQSIVEHELAVSLASATLDEGQVEFVCPQLCVDFLTEPHGEVQVHAGMIAPKFEKNVGKCLRNKVFRYSEADVARQFRTAEVVHRLFLCSDDLAGESQHRGAVGSQNHPVCVTGEQLAPDLLLEFCDVPADCRLAQSELLGCRGESSGVFDREEGSEQYRIEHHELLSQIAITNIAFICYCDNAVRRSVCSVKFLSRFYIDGFILAILAAVGVASVFPAAGAAADVLGWATKVAIGLLFLIYGARLSPSEAWQGVKHWRLHSVILAVTFVVFPLLGLALRILVPSVLSDELYTGILFLCLVPSTVQSSIAFTSIARGNVAGAVVSASFSNLVGVFVTPLLVILLMNTTGDVHVDASSIIAIVFQLLVPFFLGQLLRPWIGEWLKRNAKPTKLVDRGSIVLVVYAAFSEGMNENIWSTVQPGQIAVLFGVCVALLSVVLGVTLVIGKVLGFSVEDRIVVLFCGSKKSLASGVPMAVVLFGGSQVGLIMLPLMIFHQIQLIVCAIIAQRLSRRPLAVADLSESDDVSLHSGGS